MRFWLLLTLVLVCGTAAAQQRFEFEALRLAQIDPIPYVHHSPSRNEDS